MPSKESTTNSGITTSNTGDRVIPSSVRPDGSVRKEIRVKPGYKPPEDVEVYKNRPAEARKHQGKGGVPGATFVESPAPPKKSKATSNSSQKQVPKEPEAPVTQSLPQEPPAPKDPEAEKEKEARKLSKKLRQAKDLQQKKVQGDALLPEQLEKVIRINELVRQLDALGFDNDGNKKT